MPVSILPASTAPEGTAPTPLDGRRFANLEELAAFEQASLDAGDEYRAVVAARGTGQMLADIAESYRGGTESLRTARKRIETHLESGDHVLTARECAEIVMVWMKEAAGIPSKVKVQRVRAPVVVSPVPEQKPTIEVAPNPSAQHAFKAALTHMGAKHPEQGFACYDDACAVIEAFDVSRRKEYAAGRKAGAGETIADLQRTHRNLAESRKANAELRAALAEATGDDGKPDQPQVPPRLRRLLTNERKVTADLRAQILLLRGQVSGLEKLNDAKNELGTQRDQLLTDNAHLRDELKALRDTLNLEAPRKLLAQHELTIRAYESVVARVANALGDVRPHVGGPERLRDAADEALRTADAWRHGPIVDIVREHPGGVVAAAMQCLTSALATHRALAEAKLPLAQGATRG